MYINFYTELLMKYWLNDLGKVCIESYWYLVIITKAIRAGLVGNAFTEVPAVATSDPQTVSSRRSSHDGVIKTTRGITHYT